MRNGVFWIYYIACLTFLFSGRWFVVAQAGTEEKLPPDAKLRQAVVGAWEDEYQGHRTMTVRADGTATMVVRLQGWKAVLYASELQFEMLWSIDNARMKKRTTGGRPAGKVKMILKALGDETEEQIIELSQNRLLLLDRDGKRQDDWRRTVAASQP